MEHLMSTLRILLLSTTLATLAASAHAGGNPVYDNLSATGGYHASAGYSLFSSPPVDYAAPFVPTSDHSFDSVDLGLTAFAGVGSTVRVRLYADAGGVPGSLIEDLGTVGNLPGNSSTHLLTNLASNDRPLLLTGTTYWIRCQTGAVAPPTWRENTTSETGYARFHFAFGWEVQTGARPAMRVNGTPPVLGAVYGNLAPTGTHEPGLSWALTGANNPAGTVSRAAAFVLAKDTVLDSIQIPLLRVGAKDDVEINIYNDAGGKPGVEIEDLGIHYGFPQYSTTTSGQSTFPSATGKTLLADTTYWVVCKPAHADTYVRWAWNDKGAQGEFATFSSGNWTVQSGTELALQVDGLTGGGPVASYCTAGVSASGCQATLSAAGMPCASAGSGFVVTASNVEGAKDGVFFYGANGRQANSWGNGSSYQCVVPPVKRGGLLDGTGTTGLCDGSFSQDLTALWSANPPKNPGGGAVVQAQLWYRDPFNTSNQTTSLSDAIEFTVSP
jgi:hypothetical protein